MRIILAAATAALLATPALAATSTLTLLDDGVAAPGFTINGGSIESAQGFAGLNSAAKTFSPNLLRFGDQAALSSGFPQFGTHTSVDVSLLLAAIDSLDGLVPGFTDRLDIRVDLDGNGEVDDATDFLLSVAADNCADGSAASGLGAPFTGYFFGGFTQDNGCFDESGYVLNFSVPHSIPTFDIRFELINGQSFADETYGLDDIILTLQGVPDIDTPAPAALALFGLGLAALGLRRR